MSDRLEATPAPGSARKAIVVVGVLVVLALIGLWLGWRQPADQIQGMVDADSLNVAAKVTARLQAVNVEEGQRVEAGQALFVLDSPEVAAKERQAEAVVAAASAQAEKADNGARAQEIAMARSEWERARAGAEVAAATFRRVDNLLAEGVVTRQKHDEARAQRDSAQALARAARAQYDLALSGARQEDRQAARAQLAQAEGVRAEVEAARAETIGLAPRAGEVGKRLADVGEIVAAGYPVFTLVDIDNPWVAFHLREDQLDGLKVGDTLRGSVPALKGAEVELTVYFLSPAGDYATWRSTRQSSGYDVRSFELRARPVGKVDGLRPGMSMLLPWPQR